MEPPQASATNVAVQFESLSSCWSMAVTHDAHARGSVSAWHVVVAVWHADCAACGVARYAVSSPARVWCGLPKRAWYGLDARRRAFFVLDARCTGAAAASLCIAAFTQKHFGRRLARPRR